MVSRFGRHAATHFSTLTPQSYEPSVTLSVTILIEVKHRHTSYLPYQPPCEVPSRYGGGTGTYRRPLHLTGSLPRQRGPAATDPLFRTNTRSPIGPTVVRGHRTGRHPEVSPRDGGLSPGTARIDRTRTHIHAHANDRLESRDAHGTGHHGTPQKRTYTSLTGSPRPARWPTIELACLLDRMPLLAASACRARAQLKLPPARLMQDISRAGWTATIVGLGAKPYARTAAATRPLLPATTTYAARKSRWIGQRPPALDDEYRCEAW